MRKIHWRWLRACWPGIERTISIRTFITSISNYAWHNWVSPRHCSMIEIDLSKREIWQFIIKIKIHSTNDFLISSSPSVIFFLSLLPFNRKSRDNSNFPFYKNDFSALKKSDFSYFHIFSMTLWIFRISTLQFSSSFAIGCRSTNENTQNYVYNDKKNCHMRRHTATVSVNVHVGHATMCERENEKRRKWTEGKLQCPKTLDNDHPSSPWDAQT